MTKRICILVIALALLAASLPANAATYTAGGAAGLPMTVTCSCPDDPILVGSPVTITAACDGAASLQIQVVEPDSHQVFSDGDTFVFTPTKAGTHAVKAYGLDGNGDYLALSERVDFVVEGSGTGSAAEEKPETASADAPYEIKRIDMTKFPNTNQWLVLKKPYDLKITWEVNKPLEDDLTYIVSLVNEDDESQYLILHDRKLTENEITFSSDMLKYLIREKDDDVYVVASVEIYDLKNQKTVCKRHSDYDHDGIFHDRAIRFPDGRYSGNLSDWITNSHDAVVLFHDIVGRGYYSVGGELHMGDLTKVATLLSEVYTLGVGDIEDFNLLPAQRSVLIADAVMDAASSGSTEEIDFKAIDDLLDLIGLDTDTIEMFEFHTKAALKAAESSTANPKAFENAVKGMQNTEKIMSAFSGVTNAVEAGLVLYSCYCDFVKYRKADKKVVKQYIEDFRKKSKLDVLNVLGKAADNLEAMIESEDSLKKYLLKVYGCNYIADKGIEKTEEFFFGVKWTVMKTIVKLTGNVYFNAGNVFAAGYDLMALTDAAETVRLDFEDTYSSFLTDPYRYYEQLVAQKDVLLRITRLEIDLYNTVYIELNKGAVVRQFDFLMDKVFNKKMDNYVDPDEWVEKMEKYFDEGMHYYYAAFVAPYTNNCHPGEPGYDKFP